MNGFTTSTCFYTAVLMLSAISFDRYVAIVLATKYQKLLTKKRGYVIIIIIWLTSSLLSLPPLIGWSSYQYHSGTLHCSPVWIGQCAYFYFTFAIAVITPTSMTVFSYAVIFMKVRKHRKRVSMWKQKNERENPSAVDTDEGSLAMSRIATINKSPAVVRKESLVIERHDVVSRSEFSTNSPALARNSISPLLNTPLMGTRSLSKEPLDQQVARHKSQSADRKQIDFRIESHDFFYNPKTSKSPKLPMKLETPMVVASSRKEDNQESCPKMRNKDESKTVAGSDQERVVDTKEATMLCADSKNMPTIIADGEKIKKEMGSSEKLSRKKTKKSSIGNFLSLSRAQKAETRKLNEGDTNELLNLSETNDLKSSLSSSVDTTEMALSESKDRENKNGEDMLTDGKSLDKSGEKRFPRLKSSNKTSKVKKNFAASVADCVGVNKAEKKLRSFSRRTSKLKRASRTLREFQVAKTGAILLAVFMVCYGPYTVVHLCHLPFPVPEWTQHFAMWCVFLNSFLTPVIYGLMNKETRTKVKAVLPKCCSSS